MAHVFHHPLQQDEPINYEIGADTRYA